MDFKDLRLLVALYENHCDFSIHKNLGYSRTNLWNHINRIEKEMGAPLIERSKQKNFFTDFGLIFAEKSKIILETYDEIIDLKSEHLSINETNEIILSTTSAVGIGWFIPLFRDFQDQHPHLNINIFVGDELPSATENSAHIHFRPFDHKDHFIRKWYIQYTHGLFASPLYLKEHGTPENREDLKKHKIIAYGKHTFSYFEDINWHIKGKYQGLPRLKPYLTMNNTNSIYKAAAKGLGICSTSIEANKIEKDSLVRILPEIQGPVIKTYFTLRKGVSPALRNNVALFESFFKEYLQKLKIKIYQPLSSEKTSV